MSDVAAHLVDFVLPHAPTRQWVLSMPRAIRFLLARDAKLLGGAHKIFIQEVFRDLRRRSGVKPAGTARCGAVTAIQRYGGAINLNVHFHSMVLDGVYVADGRSDELRFMPLNPPSQEDLDRVLERVVKRIGDFLARKGYAGFGDPGGDGFEDQDLLAWVQAASIREWTTLSDPPHKVDVIGRRGPGEGPDWVEKPFTAENGSWSLHAGVRIRKGDRKGLEQLCRYLLRPPFAEERLERLPDGRVLYRFRRPRVDGSTHLILEPVELLEKLAALIPPPRAHLVSLAGL